MAPVTSCVPPIGRSDAQDADAFAGVSKYPARVKCALLSWMAWKDATAQALSEGNTA